MCHRLFIKFLIPSCIILLVAIIFSKDIKCLIDSLCFKKNYTLIVGVLSAPQNFEQRESIRKTWLKLISDVSVTYYFLVGKEICRVHPIDRKNPDTCLEMNTNLYQDTSETEFSTVKLDISKALNSKAVTTNIGFGFYTRGRVIVRKLGCNASFLKNMSLKVQVKLISMYDNAILGSATFDPDYINETNSQFLTKPITPVELPGGFEAQVVLDVLDTTKKFLSCEDLLWDEGPGVINFIQLIAKQNSRPWPFKKDSCSHAFMMYTIPDISILREHVATKQQRQMEWEKTNKDLSVQLKNEIKLYSDVMILDVTDVYRNLPRKIIEFFKRIEDTKYYEYVLKTDDDTFIDILRVWKHLDDLSKYDKETEPLENVNIRKSKLWWWSHFRELWRVQTAGKWRDDEYRSASYPPFPCGGGYVISRGVVQYLVRNADVLQMFQGEDVSMGVWLAGLAVTRHEASGRIAAENGILRQHVIAKYGKEMNGNRKDIKNASDLCEWTCDQDQHQELPKCNEIQLGLSEMYNTWKEYRTKGFL